MNLVRRILLAVIRRTLPVVTPRRWQLPLRYRIARWEGAYENEMLFIDRLVTDRRTAIDVGANMGFYSLRMARLFQRVIAFEANDEITRDLGAWNPGNVEIIHQALSSTRGDAVLQVPWAGGQMQNGWASLEPDNLAGAERFTEKRIKTACLDDWEFADVSFVKIDVEGHELPVLRGALGTIKRHRPVVLIEVRETNATAVSAYFRDLNYAVRSLSDFVAAAPSPQNRIFVPQ